MSNIPGPSTPNHRYSSRSTYSDRTSDEHVDAGNYHELPIPSSSTTPNEYRDDGQSTTSKDAKPAAAAPPPPASVYPPLFIGINLPGERPGIEYSYTDETLVERSLLEEYDMITSRISTPAYRARVEALFAESEEQILHQSQLSKSHAASRSMPPPASPQRLPPLQSRPLRNENTPNYNSFAARTSLDSSSFKSASSVNSTWVDRSSPVPSLFSTNTRHSLPPTASSTPFTTHKNSTQAGESLPFHSCEVPPMESDDILLLPGAHVRNVIALTAPWVELDSKNPRIAALSVQVILREIAYANYCGVTYFVVGGPKRRTNVEQYAQAISQLLSALPAYCHLLVHLPFAEEDYISSRTGERVPPEDYLSIWDVWNSIRTINNYAQNLSVALQVPPKCKFPSTVVSRWFAEPVKMLMVSSAVFVANARGYPVLPKATQALLTKFFNKNPFLITSDIDDREFQGGPTSYLLYLRHLVKTRPKPSPIEIYSDGYQDLLQQPLQPITNNLESSSYEVFERDLLKYNQYESAIRKALTALGRTHVQIAVVGAGRGPLVDRILAVSDQLGKSVYICAVEKNESATIYMTRKMQYEWAGRNIEIVCSDMRTWKPKDLRFSLIVSELFGSFGDNDLSPECLDGLDTQRLLEPDGIMIPQSYTAIFTPAMSATLYNSARNVKSTGASLGRGAATGLDGLGNSSPEPNFHTPYNVMLNAVDFLSPGQFATAWTFTHPNPFQHRNKSQGNVLANTRKCKTTFAVPNQGVLHGIAGYFECTLFQDVRISTCPVSTHEPKGGGALLSWFPIWFPISVPLYLPADSELDVSMWRLTDGKRVWYEWAAESFFAVPGTTKQRRRIRTGATELHNAKGRYFSVSL